MVYELWSNIWFRGYGNVAVASTKTYKDFEKAVIVSSDFNALFAFKPSLQGHGIACPLEVIKKYV